MADTFYQPVSGSIQMTTWFFSFGLWYGTWTGLLGTCSGRTKFLRRYCILCVFFSLDLQLFLLLSASVLVTGGGLAGLFSPCTSCLVLVLRLCESRKTSRDTPHFPTLWRSLYKGGIVSWMVLEFAGKALWVDRGVGRIFKSWLSAFNDYSTIPILGFSVVLWSALLSFLSKP